MFCTAVIFACLLFVAAKSSPFEANIDDFFEDSQGWLLFRKEIIGTKNKFGVGYPFTVKLRVENIGQSTVSDVKIHDSFDSNHFNRYDISTSSDEIDFELNEVKADGKYHEFTYQLTPKVSGVLAINRANISYVTSSGHSDIDDSTNNQDNSNVKRGLSSLYLSDNDSPFHSLSHQFYHTKLTDNYFDTPSQLSYSYFDKQYRAQQLSQNEYGLESYYLSFLNYVETIPLPYIFYRESQINNVKIKSKTPLSNNNMNQNNNNVNENSEATKTSETESETQDSESNNENSNNNNDNNNDNKKEDDTIIKSDEKQREGESNVESSKAIYDTKAEMSKFVYNSNVLLNVDFGCINVLNPSQYRRAIANHILQWLLVIFGLILMIIIPLYSFYRLQGNINEIPMIGTVLVLPLMKKIDEYILPHLTKHLGNNPMVSHITNSGSNSWNNNSGNSNNNNNNNSNNTSGNTKGGPNKTPRSPKKN